MNSSDGKSIKHLAAQLDINKIVASSLTAAPLEEEINKLKNWYSYYHKLYTCYKWKYKKLKTIKLALNMSSISLTVVGIALAPFTHFANLSITGVGVIIQGYVTKSDIAKKIESCRFAYTSYNKILIQLGTYFRGISYDEKVFLTDTKILDGIVTDICPTTVLMECQRSMIDYLTENL